MNKLNSEELIDTLVEFLNNENVYCDYSDEWDGECDYTILTIDGRLDKLKLIAFLENNQDKFIINEDK